MSSQEINKKYYPALDGLRAFSAVGIVVMHVLVNGDFNLKGFAFDWLIPSFTNLVFLFMIISGFATCCGYYDKVTGGNFDIATFYTKRFKKIWPFFAIICLAELIIEHTVSGLYESFANLTMLFGFINKEMTIVGVGWFIGVVFIFYLIFPFVCYLLSDKKRAWISLAVALILNIVCEYYFDIWRSNFAYCVVYFLVGGMIYLYRERLKEISHKYKWIIILFCAAITVIYYLIGYNTLTGILLYSLCVIYAIGSDGCVLHNPVTRFMSGISMEIYLCHMPVFKVLQKLQLNQILGEGLIYYTVLIILTLAGATVITLAVNKIISLIKAHLYKKNKN